MYKALKPCSLGDGKKYFIGDIIPDEMIAPTAVNRLISMGYITPQGEIKAEPEKEAEPPKITLYIHSIDPEGDVEVQPTMEGLQAIFDALGSNVAEAEQIINQMTDPEALLLLHVSDSRKSVQAAAEARAKAISEEAGEQ